MARGEPGLPQKFRWRQKEFMVAEVLEQWKDHGNCRNGSGERYVRKHGYRIRTADGTVMILYFQRSAGRGSFPANRAGGFRARRIPPKRLREARPY
jgi:hypothetical protein